LTGTAVSGSELAGAEFVEWRRVDPRTVVVYATPVVLFGAWYLLSTGASSVGDRAGIWLEALLPLLGVVAVLVRYLTGRYAIVDGALRWKVGLLVHKATDIGLDRIQDVEVTRPLLARLTGLAAVNVSSAGGSGEIKLQYLDHRVAERLGAHLQYLIGVERHAAAVQGYSTAPIGGVAPPGSAADAALLHRVDSRELARWALYRLWPVAPVAVAAVVATAVVDWKAVLPILPVLPFWLTGIVKPLLDRTNLTVSIDPTSLVTSEGLTTVRRTSTQRERVQLVYGHQLWLQRRFGAETVRYASADVTIDRKEGAVREELALNVPVDTWGTLAATIAHRQVIGPDWLRPKPAATATASTIRWAFGGTGFGVVAAIALLGAGVVVWALVVLVVSALLAAAFGWYRGRRRLAVEGWAIGSADLLVRHGVLRRTTLLLFAEKTQAIDVVSGPLQRRLGLVTVLVDVAPPGRAHRVVLHDVSATDGEQLLAALTAAGSVPLPSGV